MKLVLIAILLVLIIGCAPVPPSDKPALESKPVEEVKEPVKPKVQIKPAVLEEDLADKLAKEQEEKIIEELETIPKFEPRDRDTSAKQFWAMYAQNISSYQFKYAGKGEYYVRGDLVRYVPDDPIILNQYTDDEGKLYRQVYLDFVYLNLDEQIAVGYCEGIWENDINKRCAELEIYDIPFTLEYEKYIIKLPHDWLLEYQDKPPVVEEKQKYYISGRQTSLLVFEDEVQFFIDPRIGLPVRVVEGPLEKYSFESMVANQVRDVDVVHRSRSDIPQDEMFNRPKY